MKAEHQAHFIDHTAYARSIGYTGKAAVIVSDGRVISHAGQDWFEFCEQHSTLKLETPEAGQLALEADRAEAKRQIQERQAARLVGDAGELGTADMFDRTAGQTPLFA